METISTLFNVLQKEWNMKSSLINVFVSFLLLSYSRLIDFSFSLLYTTAYNPRGKAMGRYFYYDSSNGFFDEEHRLFAIFVWKKVGIPFLLSFLYSMKWFRECLNFVKVAG